MATQIYNTTIGRYVEVPDHHAEQYLQDERYQRHGPDAEQPVVIDAHGIETYGTPLTEEETALVKRATKKGK